MSPLPGNNSPFGPGRNDRPRLSAVEAAKLRDRFEELLIDRATIGLPAHEEAELELIADKLGRPIDDGFELAAAAADLAFTTPSLDKLSMPADLQARVLAAGSLWADQQRSPHASDQHDDEDHARLTLVGLDEAPLARRRTGVLAGARTWGGWAAAAACLVFAVYTKNSTQNGPVMPAPTGPGETTAVAADPMASLLSMIRKQTPAQARAAIINAKFKDAADVMSVQLLAAGTFSPDEVSVPLSLGEVIWSTQKQEGMLYLTALAPLDRPGETYQLWIVDAMRDSRYPVNAGTFTVGSEAPSLIPFRPLLQVSDATQFMVTIERAGGVVVSSGDDVTAIAPKPEINADAAASMVEPAAAIKAIDARTPGVSGQ